MRYSNARSRNSTAICALGRRSLFGLSLMLMLAVAGPQVAPAQEPVQCEEALTRALDLFEMEADFEAARDLLEECERQDAFSLEEKPEVYLLKARIYEAMGLVEQMKTALAQLLALVPGWTPGPDVPPQVRQMVEEYRREMERQEPDVKVAPARGEAVLNVQLRQDGDRWVVAYDLVGTAKKYRVRLLLSTDGGRSFDALPQAVTGDVGKGIRPGAGKEIVWAAGQDFPQGLAGDQYYVQVEAEKQGGRGLLYVLGGAVVAGGGVTAALLLGGGGGNGETTIEPTPPQTIPTPPGRPPGN